MCVLWMCNEFSINLPSSGRVHPSSLPPVNHRRNKSLTEYYIIRTHYLRRINVFFPRFVNISILWGFFFCFQDVYVTTQYQNKFSGPKRSKYKNTVDCVYYNNPSYCGKYFEYTSKRIFDLITCLVFATYMYYIWVKNIFLSSGPMCLNISAE